MTIVFHEDGIDSDYIDMEFGKSLDRSSRLSLTTNNGITNEIQTLLRHHLALF